MKKVYVVKHKKTGEIVPLSFRYSCFAIFKNRACAENWLNSDFDYVKDKSQYCIEEVEYPNDVFINTHGIKMLFRYAVYTILAIVGSAGILDLAIDFVRHYFLQ